MEKLYLFAFGGWCFPMNRTSRKRIADIACYILCHPEIECTILFARKAEKGSRRTIAPFYQTMEGRLLNKLRWAKIQGKPFVTPRVIELHATGQSVKEETAALQTYLGTAGIKECRIMFPLHHACSVWLHLNKTFPDTTFYLLLPAWVSKITGIWKRPENQELSLENA